MAEGPALEVLRHAVHNPGEVGAWLAEELFDHPLHREALRALAEAGSPAAAVAANPSPVADLVARLVMDEPRSEPFHAVRLLLRDVAQRKLKELSFTTGTVPDPDLVLADSAFLKRCIGDLAPDQRDAARSVVAAERLLAWLRHGSETGDGD